MKKIEFWKRMANEQASKTLYVKIPPVLDEILQGKGNKSQYVIDLIIADYERQQDTAPAEEGQ